MLLRDPELILLVLAILQFVSIFIGFITGSQHEIKIGFPSAVGQRLVDPVTFKLDNWLWDYRRNYLNNNNWFLLIIFNFLEKFIVFALITRVFYGFIFIIPLLLTIWIGFSQGVNLTKPKGRVSFALIMYDIGYILAGVLGIKFGIQVFDLLIKGGSFSGQLPWNYLLYAGIFIIIGSISETMALKSLAEEIDITRLEREDIERV